MRFTVFLVLLAATAARADELADGDPVAAHMSVGRAMYQAGRFREAAEEYKAARRIEVRPSIELALGRCYDELHDRSSAIHYYLAFLRASPRSIDAPGVRERVKTLKRQLVDEPASQEEAAVAEEEEPPAGDAMPKYRREDANGRRGAVPRHRFGFGFGLGGGYEWASTPIGDFSLSSINLLDISFFFPVSGSFEVQLWIPLANMIIVNLDKGPAFMADVAFKIYPRGDSSGFFIAPGIGVTYVEFRGTSVTGSELKIPIRLGWEWASDRRGFGFSLAAKPEIGLVAASSSSLSAVAVAYGVLGEMSFNFYSSGF